MVFENVNVVCMATVLELEIFWVCRQSRMDALSAVRACVDSWGLEVIDPQLAAIWRGLRNVLLSRPDSSEGGTGLWSPSQEHNMLVH